VKLDLPRPADGRAAVTTDKQGAVTTVILSRPERRNAIDRPTAQALARAFRAFERDPEARVAVLWGAGGTFCAGADLKAIAAGTARLPLTYGDGPMGPTRLRLSKPVIAGVAGHAVAGGLELALWCDLRVVEEDAVMGVFNRRWGIPLLDGGTVRLPTIVGLGRALDLILTGRPVDAREALAMGLANRVVPRGRAREEAERLAQTIAGFPPHAVRSDRQSAYQGQGLALGAALRREFALGRRWRARGDRLDGARRFAAGAGRHGQF
jgi:enoyl-CoA hydratase/carnithine racemase